MCSNARIPPGSSLKIARVGASRDDAEIVYPAISRESMDHHLITNAVVYQADRLVSSDRHLLVLGELDGVRIVIVNPV